MTKDARYLAALQAEQLKRVAERSLPGLCPPGLADLGTDDGVSPELAYRPRLRIPRSRDRR